MRQMYHIDGLTHQFLILNRRVSPPATIGMKNVITGEVSELTMPATSDVLQYFTEDGTKISVRPSGTEPKIKFYIEVRGEMKSRADYNAADAAANVKIEAVRASLGV